MGSWNGTCAVSNLHVHSGQRVAVFMLLKNKAAKSFCYGNALYDVCPVPFYGKYNDYGAVEDCEGFGLDLVVEAIRSQLYQFGQGPNSSHDCAVNKDNFNIDMLFEADHEDRLGVEDHSYFDHDEYDKRRLEEQREEKGLSDSQAFELDRLASKIKKVDTFRQVTHVIIHGVIFDSIMEKWYIEDYVGDGKGDTGYQKNYRHIYFKDLVAGIPEYVNRYKDGSLNEEAIRAQIKTMTAAGASETELEPWFDKLFACRPGSGSNSDWNNPCMAIRWMSSFGNSSSDEFGLIDVNECVREYIAQSDWEGLAAFTKEVLTAKWVNSFMAFTRKIWTKQTGAGSQNSEEIGYRMLSQAVLDALQADRERYGYEEDEEDDEVADASA